jgi:hypothetical protein
MCFCAWKLLGWESYGDVTQPGNPNHTWVIDPKNSDVTASIHKVQILVNTLEFLCYAYIL